MSAFSNVLLAALGIGFLIFIHEFGHFLCARLARVRVDVFSLGFGRRLCGFVWRGTDYRVSLVPIGGYVRVAGEDPTDRRYLAPDDLYAKGFGARALFFSGGVIMNLLFALLAFILVFRHGVEFTAPVLGPVDPGGPAWEAGLQPGDRVLRVNGKEMYSFENFQVEVALAGRRPIDLEVQRGDVFDVRLDARYSDSLGLYGIGVQAPSSPEPIRIAEVVPGSRAEGAGLRADDRIVAIDGTEVSGFAAEDALFGLRTRVGQTVHLEVLRDGKRLAFAYEPDTATSKTPRIGVEPARTKVRGLRPGLPLLRRLGLARGDVVLRIDGEPFLGGSFEEAVTRGSGPVSIEVRRDGRSLALQADATADERTALPGHVALGEEPDRVAVVPQSDSPAAQAGIEAGDVVVAVNERKIHTWGDLVDAVRKAAETPLAFRLRRGDSPLTITVTPTRQPLADLGLELVYERHNHLYRIDSIGGSIRAGFVASIDLIKQLYVTLKRLFTGDVSSRNLGGIIQISRVSYHYAHGDWAVFLHFLALLSINLAFINILPIPVLDGGHLLFLLIERIKGSPVSARVVGYSQLLGLVFVIALMVFVTYNDRALDRSTGAEAQEARVQHGAEQEPRHRLPDRGAVPFPTATPHPPDERRRQRSAQRSGRPRLRQREQREAGSDRRHGLDADHCPRRHTGGVLERAEDRHGDDVQSVDGGGDQDRAAGR
jgi:regulator of sigma E protease